MLPLVLLLLTDQTATSPFIVYSVPETEIALQTDSTDADLWADYGWALFAEGEDIETIKWVFSKAFFEEAECSSALRGLAAVASLEGEFATISLREQDGVLARVMMLSLLQESGSINEADSILALLRIDAGFPGAVLRLLEIRNSRLAGDSAEVQDGFAIDEGAVSSLLGIEEALMTGNLSVIERSELFKAATFDRLFLGSVYKDIIVQLAEELYPDEHLPALMLLSSYGLHKDVSNQLEHYVPEHYTSEEAIWLADLYIESDKLDEAMSVVEHLINEDSLSAEPWQRKGLLLLISYQYYEAYYEMKNALAFVGNDPTCMAILGLAAEMANESRLALECYSELLELYPDSLVLVNRIREQVSGEEINFNFEYKELDAFAESARSFLNGNICLNYSSTSGEVDQSILGASIALQHFYGMYGSVISLQGSYRNQKWPGESSDRTTMDASGICTIHGIGSYYVDGNVFWQKVKYDSDRWKLGIRGGFGRYFALYQPLGLDIMTQLGREINQWEVGGVHESTWTVSGRSSLDFRGYHINNYLPTVSLVMEAVQDINSLSRYDLYSSIDFTFQLFSELNISTGYSNEFLSAVPPDYEDITNGANYLRITYRF